MTDDTLLIKTLRRPRRYKGLYLELFVSMFRYPERVDDETAHALALPVGDAIEMEAVCFRQDGHAVSVPVFACGEVADWFDQELPLQNDPKKGWRVKGVWLFGVTGDVLDVPTSHFGLRLDSLPIADELPT